MTREHPILMSTPMVRALLAGSKTQTRRVVKWRNLYPGLNMAFTGLDVHSYVPGLFTLEAHGRTGVESRSGATRCPHGEPGDRLWVRETWGYFDPDGTGEDYDQQTNDDGASGPCKAYAAEMMQDGHALREYWRRRVTYAASWQDRRYGGGVEGPKKWRPSIHMPRWASRISLEITEVRVQRLQAISEADACDEGITYDPTCDEEGRAGGYHWNRTREDETVWPTAAQAYRELWDSINGKTPGAVWAANPWVWAVSFKAIKP